MRHFWLWIVATIVLWPVSTPVAEAEGKPVDLTLSDFFFLLMPFIYMLARSKPKSFELKSFKSKFHAYHPIPTLAVTFVVYVIALAAIGYGISGESVRLYSAFKLSKPIGFVILGLILGSWIDPLEFLDVTGGVYGIIVALTMFFTVTGPEFPLGAWGKYIFEWELSGYPNMPMSFYAGLVPVLLASTESSKFPLLRIAGWGLSACTVLIVLGSMSRSSGIVLLCGGSAYLIRTGRTAILMVGLVVVGLIGTIGYGLFDALQDTEVVSILTERVQERLDRSTESEDPTSGRMDAWIFAVELAADKPIFGYMFEPFSHYYHYDTPHQQYLEVLYKCGAMGLFIYLGIIGGCFASVSRLLRQTVKGSKHWFLLHGILSMLTGLLFGNLTQPNFTYSLTGNMVFLLFGCLCSSRAMLSVSLRTPSPVSKTIRPISTPIRRIAA